jgi:protein-S-isoprenylcysteine O-methyltransferase Ste14
MFGLVGACSVVGSKRIGRNPLLVWWAGLLILIMIEEESLERALGQTYLEYKKRVGGRVIPGLPL